MDLTHLPIDWTLGWTTILWDVEILGGILIYLQLRTLQNFFQTWISNVARYNIAICAYGLTIVLPRSVVSRWQLRYFKMRSKLGVFYEIRAHHLWLKKEIHHHFARKDNTNLELYDLHLTLTNGLTIVSALGGWPSWAKSRNCWRWRSRRNATDFYVNYRRNLTTRVHTIYSTT
jgi:hypothetical protein